MSEFTNHIHERHGFKLSNQNGLHKHLLEEKSVMDRHFCHEEHMQDLKNDDVDEEEYV